MTTELCELRLDHLDPIQELGLTEVSIGGCWAATRGTALTLMALASSLWLLGAGADEEDDALGAAPAVLEYGSYWHWRAARWQFTHMGRSPEHLTLR
jgi:hypothetical protein